MPFGFKTGAGVIFGTSGGITGGARYRGEGGGTRLEGVVSAPCAWETTRATVNVAPGVDLKLAIVHGLAARRVAGA